MPINRSINPRLSSRNENAFDKPSDYLEDFIRRANKANIRTEEPGQERQEETWEVIDGDETQESAQRKQDNQIKHGWVLIAKSKDDVEQGE